MHQQDQINDKIVDLQCMRDNLIFSGIEEAPDFKENGEDCEAVIKNFIANQMQLEGDFPFDRVHRLGRYNSEAHSREIYFSQRQRVRTTKCTKYLKRHKLFREGTIPTRNRNKTKTII